jgi:hypothetical protein
MRCGSSCGFTVCSCLIALLGYTARSLQACVLQDMNTARSLLLVCESLRFPEDFSSVP